ncbi:TadE/TadG family protein [Bradyrhizobium sp. AUGA SZCCT0222]|uniref:TadE/TadG family type IV pilus assembly protein n=1 Tax=Bradyrhizobium sp. AUGA SZCCT0222 TaxID=2807668 RepID=UPI001BA92336|nr:pilus assembly protein [Bradyrhizobium sp. AUGA SZCCT0222]MBR1271115.1 TadE/TadG family protein [Bradyrhizobium sp. AUGA SZCCT0222]
MLNTAIFSRVRKAAGRFAKADQGNIAVLFAIAAVPILSFVGAAIDYTRANSARSSMQAALDSTALMLAKDLSDGTIKASDINTKAQDYFKALYTNTDAREIKVAAEYTANTGKGSTIKINGTGNVPTEFMKVAGFPQIGFDTSSTSLWGNVRMRVALALDVTGSMDNDGKMTAMKPAAKALIDQIGALAKNTGDIYISVVPFAKDVNVGASNYDQSWINWSEWEEDNGGKFGTCSDTQYTKKSKCEKNSKVWTPNHTKWNGCVTDRDQDYDTKNTTPTSDPATKFYAEQYDACPEQLLPLTTDFASAKSKVDSLTPNGGTNQPIGIAWGWQSLTQGAPLYAPPEDANYTYKRVLIVMSDGLNTQDRWPSYGNGQNQYNGAIDARQKIQCDNIKADGVIIYTMHVNTNGDPTSSVLQYCASGADKFSTVTSSSQIAMAFSAIGTSLSRLRVAK